MSPEKVPALSNGYKTRGLTAEKYYRALKRAPIYIILTTGAILMLFPIFWMLTTSVKKDFYSTGENMIWFPPPWEAKYFTLDHYGDIFSKSSESSTGESSNFAVSTINTFVYTSVATFLNILFCSMAGYAFAKKRFRGKDLIFMALLATMMIPGIMVLLPNFIITARFLGAYDSFAGLILPGMASSFGVFLMRQYMTSIPDPLIDAASLSRLS